MAKEKTSQNSNSQPSKQYRALKIITVVIVLAGILAYFGPWLSDMIGVFNSSLILAVLIVAYFQSETDDLAARIAFLEKRMLGVSTKENR